MINSFKIGEYMYVYIFSGPDCQSVGRRNINKSKRNRNMNWHTESFEIFNDNTCNIG